MAKDKYRSGGDGGGGGTGTTVASDRGASVIAVNDKGLMATTTTTAATKTSLQLSSVRGSFGSSSIPVPGALHITKQQFHQQLKHTRSKR